MKLINQNDYPDKIYITKTKKPEYLSGLTTTIKSSGCGICNAMMVAQFFNQELTLDEAIQISYDCQANTSYGTKYVPYTRGLCDKLGLISKRVDNKDDLFNALDSQGCAVVNVGGDHDDHIGIFSHGGHYIFIHHHQGDEVWILDPGIEKGKYDQPCNRDKVRMDGEYVVSHIDNLLSDVTNRELPFFVYHKRPDSFNMNDVFKCIDQLKDTYLQIWKNIVLIDSPSAFKEGVDRVGQYFINFADRYMWDVEKQENEKAGNALALIMNGDQPGQPIVISGHMDTVHPVGSMETYEKDGKLYGPGVTDCKGGLVVCLLAMQALHDCGFRNRKVIFLLQGDEEVGSKLSQKKNIEWMIEKSKDAIAFLNTEMSMDGTAVTVRKGILSYRIVVHGVAAHASVCYEGVSAIKEAAYKIIELEKLQQEEGITVNVGLINGGTAANTVPDQCTMQVDVRFNNEAQKQQAKAYIESVCNKTYLGGSNTELITLGERCAMEEKELNSNLLDRMNDIYKKYGLPLLTARKTNGGSDASNISSADIPAIDSIGVSGGRIHSKDEFANIDSLTEKAKAIACVITDLE